MPTKAHKFAGVQDLTMLSMSETGKEFESPAEEILVRGIKIKIKDMEKTLEVKDGIKTDSNKFRKT